MVKIEKLFDGAKGTFTREGKQLSIFTNQLLSLPEYDTLVVTEGRVLVSINEEQLVEVLPQAGQQLTLNISSNTEAGGEEVVLETKSEPDTTAVETATEEATPPAEVAEQKPIIVKPAPRKK